MIDPDYSLIAALAIFLAFDLLVAAARSAVTNATLTRLLAQRDSREKGVPLAIQILTAPAHPRAALHLAQILFHFLLAGFALWRLAPAGRDRAVDLILSVAILVIAAAVIAWLEWLVEGRVAARPEDSTVRFSPFIRALTLLFYPLLALNRRILRTSQAGETGPAVVTEDELKIMVDAGQHDGVLEREEREMIYSIFRLGDTLAREIMVPRIDVTALEVNTPPDEAIEVLLRTGHSRVPVYEDTIDHILGLLYAKDMLKLRREGGQPKSLRDLLRPAYFVPEAKKVDELLAEMQSRRIHLALVVDEYGGIAGLVTMEDIVEEIVGEIQDEYDQAEELPYQQVAEGEYLFQGRVDLVDFNEVMGSDLPREEADTLGGFIYNRIGRVPAPQEAIQVNDLLLTVEQVSGRRIRKVRAQRLASDPGDSENGRRDESHVADG